MMRRDVTILRCLHIYPDASINTSFNEVLSKFLVVSIIAFNVTSFDDCNEFQTATVI